MNKMPSTPASAAHTPLSDAEIASLAHTLFLYCTARTDNEADAEDLCGEIWLALYESLPHLREDTAFYGFFWSIAGNVVKRFYRKKQRVRLEALSDTLTETLADPDAAPERYMEEPDADIFRLRRELALLHRRHRQAVVLYYIDRLPCAEIGRRMGISESMVKYLLFRSRMLLREGLTMERAYGELCYRPVELSIGFFGEGTDPYTQLRGRRTRMLQNILYACYNDALTAEEVSLAIGVALPYLEEELAILTEDGLLVREGKRYSTDIVLFTKAYQRETIEATVSLEKAIAAIVQNAVETKADTLRKTVFHANPTFREMAEPTFRWQMSALLLRLSVLDRLQSRIVREIPENKYGTRSFVWGCEIDPDKKPDPFAVAYATVDDGDSGHHGARGRIVFLDLPLFGEMYHTYFFQRKGAAHVFFSLLSGTSVSALGENDRFLAGEMVERGYFHADSGILRPAMPVCTCAECDALAAAFEEDIAKISDTGAALAGTAMDILLEHVPVRCKKSVRSGAYGFLWALDHAVASPLAALYASGFLTAIRNPAEMLPTAFAVLY